MRNDFSNGMGTQLRSAPLVADQVHASGGGNNAAGMNVESFTGLVGLAVLLSCTGWSMPSTT